MLISMKLGEIAILMREIADRCPSLEGTTFTLVPQKAAFPHYAGYHINIKGTLDRDTIGCLRRIVEGHDLEMKIKSDSVLIFYARQ